MELSRATIGRLPIYLDYLKHLPTETKTISATSIAKALNLGDVQVRKDLSAACGLGRPKIGYEVTELTRALEATVTHAFDLLPNGNPEVHPVEELPTYCSLHQVEIGIITVPPEAAQGVADLLVKCGVQAIWCFAPVRLNLPQEITVQYENLALSLAHLHQKVKAATKRKG